MPTPVIESAEGGQHVEWSETFHAFLFRAGIYLKRFWWILIITVAAGVLLQKWKLRDAKPIYLSSGEMTPGMQVFANTGTSAGASEIVSNYWGQQIHFLQEPSLFQTAYDNAMAQDSKYERIKPSVTTAADLILNTNVLSLRVTGSDRDFTKAFLDAWMEAFLRERKLKRDQAMQSLYLQLTGEAQQYQDDEKKVNDELSEFLSTKQIASVETAQALAADVEKNMRDAAYAVYSYRNQLIPLLLPTPLPAEVKAGAEKTPGANMQTTAANAANADDVAYPWDEQKFKDYIGDNKDHLEGTDTDITDRELLSHGLLPLDPKYEEAKKQLSLFQARYKELATGLGEAHPKIEEVKLQIFTTEIALQEMRLQRVDALKHVRIGLINELKVSEDAKKLYEGQNNDYLEIMKKINAFKVQINQDHDRSTNLLQGSKSLEESLHLAQEMLYVLQPASEPITQMPDQAKLITQGAMVGLAGGIVLIFLLGMLDGRVLSVEDLSQRFDEPMLGVIPMQKRVNGQVELLKHNDQRQMFAESCRNIRSSLLYMDRQGQRPRIIMLTSSMPSEGKSTLSSNLAITLGFAASRTLLVDADMRRGQLHKRFGLKNDVGLAEHIGAGVPLEQVIQPTTSENLDFISCGKYPTQPGELLMSDRFRDTIQTLRQRYDFVVFDSPPILLTDDAASFATRSDAVIFVVRAGYTRMRQVRSSLESLHRRGVNVYGMVVNFIDHREPGYYTYRYYDYYSYRTESPDKKKERSA